MSDVLAILDGYLADGDFESARDALHALGPTAMSEGSRSRPHTQRRAASSSSSWCWRTSASYF